MKRLLEFFLTAIIFSIILVSGLNFEVAQASTEVVGIINADTTWTKENSPYTLTGPIFVNNDITLTIEPGVVVNLNGYLLQVNGTLVARGSSIDSIQLNEGRITFLYSTAWNEQDNSGTIIENTILNSVHMDIRSSSIKINNNMINGGFIQSHIEGSDTDLYLAHETLTAIISNNHIIGGSHSSVIEALNTDVIFNNTIICTQNQRRGINAQYYSSVISNTITGLRGYGIIGGKNVSGNVVSGFEVGIEAGYAMVANNLVFNNTYGIEIGGLGSIVQNNTIANNTIGVYSAQGYFNYNNFENNSKYNIYASSSKSDVNATYNWWGTTDTVLIDQKIYDNNDDFRLGKVDYMPFLTAVNTQAAPDSNPLTPTLGASPSPTSPSPSTSPSQCPITTPQASSTQTGVLFGLDWMKTAIIILSLMVILLVVVTMFLRKRKAK